MNIYISSRRVLFFKQWWANKRPSATCMSACCCCAFWHCNHLFMHCPLLPVVSITTTTIATPMHTIIALNWKAQPSVERRSIQLVGYETGNRRFSEQVESCCVQQQLHPRISILHTPDILSHEPTDRRTHTHAPCWSVIDFLYSNVVSTNNARVEIANK